MTEHKAASEDVLLGALLLDNSRLPEVSALLAPDRFADPVNGAIYSAINRAVTAGQTADAASLRAEFEHTGVLDEVGGTPYLAQLAAAPRSGQIDIHKCAQSIHDAWMGRKAPDDGQPL